MDKIHSFIVVFLTAMLVSLVVSPVLAGGFGSISGTVFDGTDLPLGNATVIIHSYTGSYAAQTITDPSGNYSFPTLSSDLYTISFAKSGYLSRWNGGAASQDTAIPLPLNAPDALANINSKLPLGGSIRGTVIDAAGIPISGASVFAEDFNGFRFHFADTDTSGNFTLSGMESGTYYVHFSAFSYQSVWYGGVLTKYASTQVVVTAPNATTAINGQLGVGGSISGTITDLTLSPLPNVNVILQGPSFLSMSTTSDASGNYLFKGVGNGIYYVQAAYSAWYGGATINTALPITMASPSDVITGINIALDAGLGGITGKVTDYNDVPISNASLTLYDSTGTAVSFALGGSSTSDEGGNFSFAGLKSGDYYIKCFSPGMPETWFGGVLAWSGATAIPLTSPNTVSGANIKMGVGSSIGGTVTNTIGSPLAGVTVDLYDSAGKWIVGGGATTDYFGNYIFRGFPVGTYYVQFSSPSNYGSPVWYGGTTSQALAAPVVIVGPTPVTGIDAQIGGDVRISGAVRGPLNNLIASATVGLYDQSGIRVLTVFSDETGAYRFTDIPPGMYFLLFSKKGLRSSWYENKMTQQTATPVMVTSSSVASGIDGVLALGGRISGTVTDAASNPMPFATVTLYKKDGSYLFSSQTDSSGNYSLAGVSDGQYYVGFSASRLQKIWYGGTPFMQAATPVTVSGSNHVAGIDVQLQTGGTISGTISNGNEFVKVCLYDVVGQRVASTRLLDGYGHYFFTGLQTGTYYVQVTELFDYRAIWFGGLTFQTATPVMVTAPQTVNNINLAYDASGLNWMETYVETNGTITGSPTGVLCSKDITSGCSVAYASTETVTLIATPNSDSYFAGWGGDCQGTSACNLAMTTSHYVTALFQPAPKAKINDTGYFTLNLASNAASSFSIIKTLDSVLEESVIFSDNKNLTIHGGYNAQFSARSGLPTILSGSLIVRNGRITADLLTVR